MYKCKEPKFSNFEETMIDVIWEHPEHGEIPFTATPDDAMDYGREIYQLALDGEFGEVAAYEPPLPMTEPVPQSISRSQGKIQLTIAGLMDDVEAYMETVTDPIEKIKADEAMNGVNTWERDSPFLNSVAQAIGLTDDGLDNLFIEASKIKI